MRRSGLLAKLDGLTNQPALVKLQVTVDSICKDLFDEGFDSEDIENYLMILTQQQTTKTLMKKIGYTQDSYIAEVGRDSQ